MAKSDTSITTIDDAPAIADSTAADTLKMIGGVAGLSGQVLEVEIHQGEGEGGKERVFVGLNGHGYKIPRSIKVIVPVEVIEILENAMMTVYESVAGITRGREVRRYSFNTRAVAGRA